MVIKHRLLLVGCLDSTVGADGRFVMFSAVLEIVEGDTFQVPVNSWMVKERDERKMGEERKRE